MRNSQVSNVVSVWVQVSNEVSGKVRKNANKTQTSKTPASAKNCVASQALPASYTNSERERLGTGRAGGVITEVGSGHRKIQGFA